MFAFTSGIGKDSSSTRKRLLGEDKEEILEEQEEDFFEEDEDESLSEDEDDGPWSISFGVGAAGFAWAFNAIARFFASTVARNVSMV